MTEPTSSSKISSRVGIALLIAGLAVFAIRLQHAGPYAAPGGGNLRAGLLAIFLGGLLASGVLSRAPLGKLLSWGALAVSPIVFFFSMYAILAETEEVVTLHAVDSRGEPADLRLWIVDHEGAEWVRMPASKADEHNLSEIDLELLRAGETRCVHVTRSGEPEIVAAINRLAYDKYRVMRLATAIGIFSGEPNPNQVVVRFDTCLPAQTIGDARI